MKALAGDDDGGAKDKKKKKKKKWIHTDMNNEQISLRLLLKLKYTMNLEAELTLKFNKNSYITVKLFIFVPHSI
jgi:hypothetical protein